MSVLKMSYPANASDAPSDLMIQKWIVTDSFPWIKKGELIYYKIGRRGLTTSSLALYAAKGDQEVITVSGSLRDAARVVNLECPEIEKSFLKEQLPKFFVFCNARPGCSIMSQDYLDAFNNSNIKDEKTHDALVSFCKEPQVLMQENNWSVVFFVLNEDNSVSEWRLKGTAKPFNILSVTISNIMERGRLVLPQGFGRP